MNYGTGGKFNEVPEPIQEVLPELQTRVRLALDVNSSELNLDQEIRYFKLLQARLGPLFERTVPPRNPGDPSVKVLKPAGTLPTVRPRGRVT